MQEPYIYIWLYKCVFHFSILRYVQDKASGIVNDGSACLTFQQHSDS